MAKRQRLKTQVCTRMQEGYAEERKGSQKCKVSLLIGSLMGSLMGVRGLPGSPYKAQQGGAGREGGGLGVLGVNEWV